MRIVRVIKNEETIIEEASSVVDLSGEHADSAGGGALELTFGDSKEWVIKMLLDKVYTVRSTKEKRLYFQIDDDEDLETLIPKIKI